MMRKSTALASAAAALLACVAVIAFVSNGSGESTTSLLSRTGVEKPTHHFSSAQVGRYGMRAERQARNFEKDSERRYDQATSLANAASRQSTLSAQMEKRSRGSAYLAADVKKRIAKLLAAGRDQVQRATQFQIKSDKLQKKAKKLMSLAVAQKRVSNREDKEYHRLLAKYEKVVDKIRKLHKKGQVILDSIHQAGVKLARIATNYQKAKRQHSSKLASIKHRLDLQQKVIAKLAQKSTLADTDMDKAKLLMDKYQPTIRRADREKFNSVQHYAHYTHLMRHSEQLKTLSTKLNARSVSLQELIKATEKELKQKRKMFYHYKHRAQLEMHIAESAEDKKEHLRAASRKAKTIAAQLEGKAMKVRKLAQKGVDKAVAASLKRQVQRDAELHDRY